MRSHGEDESQGFGGFNLRGGPDNKSALLVDLFAAVSCTAQYGNFQRLVLDLTRLHARLDFPSGSKFLTGATHLARDLYNSKPLDLQVVQAICPDITVSLQQQVRAYSVISLKFDASLTYSFYRLRIEKRVFLKLI